MVDNWAGRFDGYGCRLHRSFLSHILDVLNGLMNDLWLGDRSVQKISNFLLKCFNAVDCVVGRGLCGKNVHKLGHIEAISSGNVRNLNRGLVFESFDVCGVLVNKGLVYDQKRNNG